MSDTAELDEVVKEFLVESYENLDQLDRDLVALEQDPESKETLSSVFRTIHTIKGTCGFLGFSRLEGVAHVGENLLTKLRDGRLLLDPEITTALLAMVDAVRQMLSRIEGDGSDGDNDYPELVARLDALYRGLTPAGSAPAAPELVPGNGAHPPEESGGDCDALATPRTPGASPGAGAHASNGGAAPAPLAALAESPTHGAVHTPSVAASAGAPTQAPEVVEGRSNVSDTTVRVDVHLLDRLMNLVGELVLARNQILQLRTAHETSGFTATTQRLNHITTELQEGVMKTRMQPIGNVWSKFPRVVRDLALACGKRARIELEGRETELDRTIIEAIKDPLTHLVRNAVDHGIETPEARTAAGKPGEGRVFMRAFHEGGQVNIEISDDGGGIDPERLKEKAVSKGLITLEQAARLSEREALSLIFLPGFSTAAQVTNVSGRGVGMDVVKTNIERIGGTVDVQSQVGRGTTFKMKIPLTLAIIPALIVTSGEQRYAIPQVSLLELVRLDGEAAEKGIERIHGAPVYRLRGSLLPVLYLNELLAGSGPAPERRRSPINIVVLQADDRRFGLVVEGISDTEEIVVKPLGRQLKSIESFAGATIMGDGRVALILDVLGLAQNAGVVSEVRDRALADDSAARLGTGEGDHETMLVLGLGENGRVAVPLSLVDRLEEIPARSVEFSAHREVVQYRGDLLPLLRLGRALGYASMETAEERPLQVVVCSRAGRRVGLIVDQILDVVEEQLTMREQLAGQPGLRGTAVIRGRVTDLLDVDALVGGEPAWSDEQAVAA